MPELHVECGAHCELFPLEGQKLEGGHLEMSSLIPGFPTVQFLIACSMQKQRGKTWPILSCE